MKNLNFIILNNGSLLLSNKNYSDCKEIQSEYNEYVTSIDFESLVEFEEFLRVEYCLSPEKSKQEVSKLFEDQMTVEIVL